MQGEGKLAFFCRTQRHQIKTLRAGAPPQPSQAERRAFMARLQPGKANRVTKPTGKKTAAKMVGPAVEKVMQSVEKDLMEVKVGEVEEETSVKVKVEEMEEETSVKVEDEFDWESLEWSAASRSSNEDIIM